MKRLFMTTLVMLTLSVSFASCGTDDTEFAPNTGVPAPRQTMTIIVPVVEAVIIRVVGTIIPEEIMTTVTMK